MTTINPYLTFTGQCEEAFNFYKSVFGGEFTYVGRFKDMPENIGYTVSDDEKEKIMHISLPVSNETVLMGSDASSNFNDSLKHGNNFSISINAESFEEGERLFKGLSDGGKVLMPFEKAFWGSFYGMFADKFGVQWMVSYYPEK